MRTSREALEVFIEEAYRVKVVPGPEPEKWIYCRCACGAVVVTGAPREKMDTDERRGLAVRLVEADLGRHQEHAARREAAVVRMNLDPMLEPRPLEVPPPAGGKTRWVSSPLFVAAFAFFLCGLISVEGYLLSGSEVMEDVGIGLWAGAVVLVLAGNVEGTLRGRQGP